MATMADGSTVMAGGGGNFSFNLSSTFEWDGVDWEQVAGLPGGVRQYPAMAYDPVRDRVVMFGGGGADCQNFQPCTMLGDTWEWDGSSWTQVATTGPEPRAAMGMAYSPAAGGVVLFGGMDDLFYTPDSFFDDTWVWDGTSWSELTTAAAPSRRVVYDTMDLDPTTGEIVVFGGLGDETVDLPDGAEIHGDTWTFDGSTWTQRSSGGLTPRNGSYMAGTPDGVLMYGGQGFGGQDNGLFNESWLWDGTSWSLVESGSPPGRYVGAMSWDPVREEVVLFGGSGPVFLADDETFTWQDPANSRYVFALADHFGHRVQAGMAEDPVNTGSGNLIHDEIDIDFPQNIFGMDWARSCNSEDTTAGPVGVGWTFGHALTVTEDVSGDVTIRNGEGRQIVFTPDGGGGFDRPDEFYGELILEADTSYRVDLFDGSSWDFDTSGLLVSLTNWDGQTVTITPGADGPTDITSSSGYSLTIAYDGSGRIGTVTSSDGRTVSYGYDTAGLLTSFTDAAGETTTYRYETNGLLDLIADVDGVELVENIYDPNGRVVFQTLAGGESASFVYNNISLETTVITRPSGEVTTYQHDTEGRLVGVVDAFGNDVDLTRQGDGELTGAVSRLGETLTQSFDTNGNLLSSETTTGGTSAFVYDGSDRVSSMTESFGAETTYSYEGGERIPSTVTDDAGNTTSLSVVDGLVDSVTDPDGVTTTYVYDAQRRLVSETDGAGNTTTNTYDAAGRLETVTTPLGNTTTNGYDAEGRLLSVTDPTGAVTAYTYDAAGRLLTVTDPEGAVTTHSHDASGRLVSTTDSRGAVTTFAHDAFDQLVSTTRPGSSTTSNVWGDLGRHLSTDNPLDRTTAFGYDADGNRTSTTDPLGNVTTQTRDTAGRVLTTTDPLGRTTTNAYDSSGRLTSTTDPDGGVTSYGYDALGRQTTVTDPRGGVTTTTYTPGGRVESVTDPEGNTTSYTYDTAGRVATVTDPDHEGGVTTNGYDADGRVTSVTSAEGLVTTTTYDAAGRPLTDTDPAGVTTTLTYDGRGNAVTSQTGNDGTIAFDYDDRDLLSATDALGNTSSFDYDDRGNRTTTTDALGRTTSNTYNTADEMTSRTDARDRTTNLTYDGAGRLDTVTDASGRTVTNGYDDAGQLVSQTFGDGSTIIYTYDPAGRRETMTDATGTTSYGYDPAGNLTSVTYPEGDTLTYSYDPAGRVARLTYLNGDTVAYTYDGNNRVTSATHSTAGTTTYTYDADGRLSTETLPGGTTRSYTYTDGQLTSYIENGSTTTLTYDASGRLDETAGFEDWTFGYDPAGQLTTATRDTDSFGYGYDPVGNLTEVTGSSGSETLTVDDANQLVSSSAGVGFQYDDAGNLIQAAYPDGRIRYFTYDARGLLVRETIVDFCAGLTPTIVGTEGNDTITGTTGDDIIFALGGDDVIEATRGDDIVCGGDGADTIFGEQGDDILVGADGPDIIEGNQHHDVIVGGGSNDTLYGEQNNDIILGGPGDDTMTGRSGTDVLDGGPGTDSLDAGPGADECEAEPGAVSCDLPLSDPLDIAAATTIDRTYDGDGLLAEVTITHPDTTTDVYELTWDRNRAIPQILSLTVNGTRTDVVYGAVRALSVTGGTGTDFSQSVLGDTVGGDVTVSPGFDPYGKPDSENMTVGFGYRGELHVGGLIYLRARDYDPTLGRFLTPDPLDGVPGTTTITNQYTYANNNPIAYTDPGGMRAKDRDVLHLVDDDGGFEGFEDLGSLEVGAFIQEAVSELVVPLTNTVFGSVPIRIGLYEGDNRRFARPGPIPRDRSRFFAEIDFEFSEGEIQMNETVTADGEVFPPWPISFNEHGADVPNELVNQTVNYFALGRSLDGSAIRLAWSIVHGDRRVFAGPLFTFMLRPSFDGELTIRRLDAKSVLLSYHGDCFPSVEAQLLPPSGERLFGLEFTDKGPVYGLAIFPDCTEERVTQLP